MRALRPPNCRPGCHGSLPRVPGTAAGAVGADPGRDFDASDWWFRCAFGCGPAGDGERVLLELDGIATVSEVFLNGRLVLSSTSMWEAHSTDVTDVVSASNVLVIACRALTPLLAVSRRPRARWRTRVVGRRATCAGTGRCCSGARRGSLRVPRPSGHGGRSGWCSEDRSHSSRCRCGRRSTARMGVVRAVARVQGTPSSVELVVGGVARPAVAERFWTDVRGLASGPGRAPLVAPYARRSRRLYDAELVLDRSRLSRDRRVGFRSLSWAADIALDGLDLSRQRRAGVRAAARLDAGRHRHAQPVRATSCARCSSPSATPA